MATLVLSVCLVLWRFSLLILCGHSDQFVRVLTLTVRG